MKHTPHSRRGAALIIVLGFLGFLMLSAVAFSISMRIEKTAAASFRQNTFVRNALQSAFAEARKATDQACNLVDSANDRTIEIPGSSGYTSVRIPSFADTIPFRFPKNDPSASPRYARVISSYAEMDHDSSSTDQLRAYILSEPMMNHIPAYLGKIVREHLFDMKAPSATSWNKLQNEQYRPPHRKSGTTSTTLFSLGYPRWQYLNVLSSGQKSMQTLARYAWSVVNISDSIDVNALGLLNATPNRGLGTGARDIAWKTDTYNSYIKSADNLTLFADDWFYGGFASAADLQRAVIYTSNGQKAFNYRNLHWLSANDPRTQTSINNPPAPFATYSYHPTIWETEDSIAPDYKKNPENTLLGGSEISTEWKPDHLPDSAFAPYLCSSINITEKNHETFRNSFKDSPVFKSYATGGLISNNNGEHEIFIDLLCDYLDEDSVPFEPPSGGNYHQFTLPSVERVPMLSALGYEVAPAFKNVDALPKPDAVTDATSVTLEFTLPEAGNIKLYPYIAYPFVEESKKKDFEVDLYDGSFWTLGIVYSEKEKGTAGENDKKYLLGASKSGSDPTSKITVKPGSFTKGPDFTRHLLHVGPDGKLNLKIADFPIKNQPGEVAYEFEFYVDLYARFGIRDRDKNYFDRAPACDNRYDASMETFYNGLNGAGAVLGNATSLFTDFISDQHFFRIRQKFTADFVVTTNQELQTTFAFDKLKSVDFSTVRDETNRAKLISPKSGYWFNIDPRFNWVSPMTGLSTTDLEEILGPGSNVGTSDGAYFAPLSSPHWIFKLDEFGGFDNKINAAQRTFLDHSKAPLPVGKGKPSAILFSCADSERMNLPGEIGFLPMPPYITDTFYEPNENGSGRLIKKENLIRSFCYSIPTLHGCDENDEKKESDYRSLSKRERQQIKALLDSFIPTYQSFHRGQIHPYPYPALYPDPDTVSEGKDDSLLRAKRGDANTNLPRHSQNIIRTALQGMPATINEALANTKEEILAQQESNLPGAFRESKPKNTGDRPKTVSDSHYADDKFISGTGNNKFFLDDGFEPTSLDFLNDKDFKLLERMDNAGFGQLEANTFYAMSREMFSDRQQLFLYLLRAESVAVIPGQPLASARSLSSASAVALVWRDAYRILPDRVIYFEVLP